MHQYELLSSREENCIKKYFIPNSIFKPLETQFGSKLGVKLFLLKNRYRPLEKEIQKILRQIRKDTGKPIKGILNWNAHFVSIRYIAEKMGIPVITNEFCLRFPEFYPLGYFCKSDIYTTVEIEKMYAQFKRNFPRLSFVPLSRTEILALLLSKERLSLLTSGVKKEPIYEMGIAGCHPIIPTFFAKSAYTDLELIQDVRSLYAEKDILFRKHPGDEPYQANYTLSNNDTSAYASDFILKCQRITAVGSNILLEALLWNRKVYSKDVSPFTIFCQQHLDCKDFQVINDATINFILFGYLVPYNKMFDEEYINWRLNETNIINIIEANIKYIFQEMDIPEQVLNMSDNRLKSILEWRKAEQYE